MWQEYGWLIMLCMVCDAAILLGLLFVFMIVSLQKNSRRKRIEQKSDNDE